VILFLNISFKMAKNAEKETDDAGAWPHAGMPGNIFGIV